MGGGIYIDGGTNHETTNTTIAYNEAAASTGTIGGAGIKILSGNMTITNCVIAYNDAVNGGTFDGVGIHMQSSGNSCYLKNSIVAKNEWQGSTIGTDYYGIHEESGSVIDNGGNAFGKVDGSQFTIDGTTWVDQNGSGTPDGTFDENGTNNSGSLNLSTSLALNNTNNGTKTLALTSSSSIAKDQGVSGSNNGVSIPTSDQRGKGRNGTLDIGSYEFMPTAPSTQATNVNFPSTKGNAVTVSWTNGNGQNRVVFVKQGTSGTTSPTDQTTYTANNTFGSGTQISNSGWYCAYKGSGNQFTLQGLSTNTDYRIQVFEYNGSGGTEKYNKNTASGNPANVNSGSVTTPTTQASNVSFSSTGQNSLSFNWTNGNGANRVVFMKKTACGNTSLSDNTTYTANSTFGSGSQIGSTGWYCVFNGSGSSVSVSGLTKGETYRVQVFEYNGTAGNEKYLNSTASGNPKSEKTSSYLVNDGFETGDFSQYNWDISSGAHDFKVTSNYQNNGSYAAKSGNKGSHSSASTLKITKTLNSSGTISFYRKVSSESGYDYLRFYIDGSKQDEWSGSKSWKKKTYNVTSGQHTFKWSYEKDGSVSDNNDEGYIDDIVISDGGSGGSQTLYYVDANNGSDNNTGHSCDPYKTFDKAYSQASGGDTIDLTGTFDWSVQTAGISNKGYTLTKNLIIRGQGANQTTIKAGPKPDEFTGGASTHKRRVFTVSAGATVTLKDLSIKHGRLNNSQNNGLRDGAGINNKGSLTLNRVNLAYNSAAYCCNGGSQGAGIMADGDVTIKNSTIHHNDAVGDGGAIHVAYNCNCSVKTTNSTIFKNYSHSFGAGLYFNGGNGTVTNTTIAYNDAVNAGSNGSSNGPGIHIDRSSVTVNLKNSIVSNNKFGGSTGTSWSSDIYDNNYSLNDNGGNIIGRGYYAVSCGSCNSQHNSTWTDASGSGSSDGIYKEKGSQNTGKLNLSSTLALNNSNRGTKTLSITAGVAVNNGLSGSNNGVSIPSKDQRGFSRNGSVDIGAFENTSFQPTKNLNALDFDGSDDYVNIPDDNSLDLSTTYTIETWVKPSSFSTGAGIVSKNAGNNGYSMRLTNAGAVDFDNGLTTNKTLTTGDWYHLAVVNNSGSRKVYINGKQVATSGSASSVSTNSDPLKIGEDNSNFSGRIDEVRIWSTARTASQIRQNMARTLKGTNNGLEAYYRLNQTSGSSKTQDLSNNDNDGTLKNMDASADWVGSDAFTTWIGSDNSSWSNAANWTDGVPSSGDNVGIYQQTNMNKPTISGSPTVENLVIGSSVNPNVNSNITVKNNLLLDNILDMGNNTLTIEDNADIAPAGGASGKYVNGTIKKKGDDKFVFPLGDDGRYARLEISAPSNTTDVFTASFTDSSYSNTSSMASSSNNPNNNPQLNNVSTNEYWTLNRTNGSSSVDVTLFWENGSSAGIDDLNDLKVAHWNGSAWENLGQSSTSGTTSSGSITVTGVSNFSPFTFGSESSGSNALPVEMLSFNAELIDEAVELTWATASETNNSHFIIQKRIGDTWQKIGRVEGNGTSTVKHRYDFTDPNFRKGITHYYRLKQVDFDGSYEYSNIKSVRTENSKDITMKLYSNPVLSKGIVKISSSKPDKIPYRIVNAHGNVVQSGRFHLHKGSNQKQFNGSVLEPGLHILILEGDQEFYQQKFVKK